MVTWNSFHRGKVAWVWSCPLTTIQCQGQEWCPYTSTPFIFMVWCLTPLAGTTYRHTFWGI
jgi:hypothetical protein